MTSSTEPNSPVIATGASVEQKLKEHGLEQVKLEADTKKAEGNIEFGKQNFTAASEFYTAAINLVVSKVEDIAHSHLAQHRLKKDSGLAIYYVNRAMCHLKMENYGSALLDLTDVFELDPSDNIKSKAHYRMGLAHYALLFVEEALKDFKNVLVFNPQDVKTRSYITTIKKEITYKKFAAAISTPDEIPLYEKLNLDDFVVPANYSGPSWATDNNSHTELMTQDITMSFIKDLIEYFKAQKCLPNRLTAAIIKRVINLLKEEKNCVHVDIPDGNEITICGDVHGQFFDLVNIFELNGYPSHTNPYIFNGDFVDRGAWGVECALLLFTLKVAFPKSFFMSRGNHETKNINKIYGFKGECDEKFKMREMYELFSEAFMWLPLCHIINKKVFCVHGGLPSDDAQDVDHINRMNRYSEPTDLDTPNQVLLNDLLWADPRPEIGRVPSPRGVSSHFGPDITARFLDNNNLSYVIRSHEVKDEGYEVIHNGKMITVFSAPNYCDMVKNKGAFVRLKAPQLTPEFTTFTEVAHPSCSALQYASPLLRMA